MKVALLHGVFGERIVGAGVHLKPGKLAQPGPSPDFINSRGFGNWKLEAVLKTCLIRPLS